MNRIQQYWTTNTDSLAPDSSELAGGRFSATPDAGHALFAPLHYESNYAYPLIVWLHGANDDERQLKRIMPFVSLRNYVAVSPRGTVAADLRAEDRKSADSINAYAKAAERCGANPAASATPGIKQKSISCWPKVGCWRPWNMRKKP